MSQLSTLIKLVQLGRPHFLIGGFVLHTLGVVIGLSTGVPLSIAALVWGQIAVTGTQLMVHYANDYFDLDADRANATPTNWSGGSRILADGKLPAHAALGIALGLAGIALTADMVLSLIVRPGLTTFLLLIVPQALAWFYSAPPLRLHSRGVGEMTTALVVTLFTPLIGYYLQTGQFDALPLLTVAPLCCIQFAMLLAVEFPDADGDRQAGKRTLVVRLGSASATLYVTALVLAYALLPLLVLAGLPLIVAPAVALLSPLALWLIARVQSGAWRDPARWNSLAFYTIVLLIVTAIVAMAAFVFIIAT